MDKVLEHPMTLGRAVVGGDRLGKTTIIAKNQAHAEFIAERFGANYPHHKGAFARVTEPAARSLYGRGRADAARLALLPRGLVDRVAARGGASGPGCRRASNTTGFCATLPRRISKCTWLAVARPVRPTVPITAPCFTRSPAETRFRSLWA